LKFLKNHPFGVQAFFNSSVVLTFAVEKEQLVGLIPPCLELDTFNNKWAFIAVAMVQTSNLRPKGFPKFMGNNFFLIGYRIFVRYTNTKNKTLRGLYIIKSETNKKKMELLGNIFTQYKYTTTDINLYTTEQCRTISSKQSNFKISILPSNTDIQLPSNSPFSTWQEARKFAGPLPHTFSFNKNDNTVLIVEGLRQYWQPKPIAISDYYFQFLKELNLHNVVLANAFEINNVPYNWKKGKIEKWR
jgi:hypothetical protein